MAEIRGAWHCSCGEQYSGVTTGYLALGKHFKKAERNGETDHEKVGFVGLDTGEIVGETPDEVLSRLDPEALEAEKARRAEARREQAAEARAASKPQKAETARGEPAAAKGLRTGAALQAAPKRRFHVLAGDLFLSDAIPLMFAESVRNRPDLYEDNVLTDQDVYNSEQSEFVNWCVIQTCIREAGFLGLDRMMSEVQRYAHGAARGEAAV